jgi:hypothetical protein
VNRRILQAVLTFRDRNKSATVAHSVPEMPPRLKMAKRFGACEFLTSMGQSHSANVNDRLRQRSSFEPLEAAEGSWRRLDDHDQLILGEKFNKLGEFCAQDIGELD